MIDLIESFPDQCCTSPDVRFLGGRHPKYGPKIRRSCAMHSAYVFRLCALRLCIQAIHSSYSFRLFIQAMHSRYSFRLFIQAIHSGYPFRLFIQAIHSGYSFRLSYRTHFLRHISARRGLSGAFLRQSLFLRSLQITF